MAIEFKETFAYKEFTTKKEIKLCKNIGEAIYSFLSSQYPHIQSQFSLIYDYDLADREPIIKILFKKRLNIESEVKLFRNLIDYLDERFPIKNIQITLDYIEVENMESKKANNGKNKNAKKTQKNKPKRQRRNQNTYKDYIKTFCHNKECLIVLDCGTHIKGLVKAKDRYNILVSNYEIHPEEYSNHPMLNDVKPDKLIINKGHIRMIVPIEDAKKEDNKENEEKEGNTTNENETEN